MVILIAFTYIENYFQTIAKFYAFNIIQLFVTQNIFGFVIMITVIAAIIKNGLYSRFIARRACGPEIAKYEIIFIFSLCNKNSH